MVRTRQRTSDAIRFIVSKLTFGSRPSAHLSIEVDTNDLGALQFPRNVGHDAMKQTQHCISIFSAFLRKGEISSFQQCRVVYSLHSISSTNTTSNHSQSTRIRSMRISSNHHQSRNGVIFENDLMNDTGSWFPETDAVLHKIKQREGCRISSCKLVCNYFRMGSLLKSTLIEISIIRYDILDEPIYKLAIYSLSHNKSPRNHKPPY